jgi:hypothetical protein
MLPKSVAVLPCHLGWRTSLQHSKHACHSPAVFFWMHTCADPVCVAVAGSDSSHGMFLDNCLCIAIVSLNA